MASSRRQKCKGATILVKTPNFIKVVLDEALQDGTLEIEGYIAEMLKNCVANELNLNRPDRAIWPVAAALDADTGSLWLEKGWPEFANFYSLENGYFLIFIYEGHHSCFNVRIFKKNGLEVDYPIKSSHHEESNLCRDLTAYGVAFSRASKFKSRHPLLAVQLHSSYIASPFKIQDPFVNQYIFQGLLSHSEHLQIPNGGTWCAQCTVSLCGKHDYARIHGSWTTFSRENNLQVKDAIVLELIEQQPEVTFRVHIFRA